MRQIYLQKNHGWRDAYNPLRGLNMSRLTALQEAGERGQYADLQWLYYYMERSDAMIHSVIQRRRAALLSLDWDIRIVSQAQENPLAQEQAEFLRMVYDSIDNFREAVSFLFTGFFRGFAHLEKHWAANGLIERLEPVEQWFWLRDGLFGDWEYNPGANPGTLRGEQINSDDFIIHESAALDRILSVLYLRKNLSQRDWDSFLAVYGIPSIFLVGPPNVPEDKQKEYQSIAEQILSDGRGFLPHESDIKFVNGGGNKPPFHEQIKYLDEQITIAATGGLLTMLTEAGSGTLAGGAHQDTFLQIAKSDAVTLAGVLQNAIDVPLLEQHFPGHPVQAYFEFSPNLTQETRQVVQDALLLKAAGLEVKPEEISEKTGYTLTVLPDQTSEKRPAV
jgi:phage gp29-like protein